MASNSVRIPVSVEDKASAPLASIRAKFDALANSEGGKAIARGFGFGAGIGTFNLATDAIHNVVGELGDTIAKASDLNETVNKVDVIFGDASKSIHDFGSTAAHDLGQSDQQAEAAAATFGNLFNTIGVGQKPAADMSIAMVKLASDLASFNNIDPTEALDKLQSGLVGEAKPLRELGILLSEEQVKAEAYKDGIAKVGTELTEGQKVQARYNLILAQSKTAQGDFARTSDGLANSQRILNAEIEDAEAAIGQQLLPVVKDLVHWLADEAIPGAEKFVGTLQELATPIAELNDLLKDSGGLLGGFGDALNTLVPGIGKVGDGIFELKYDLDSLNQKTHSQADEFHMAAIQMGISTDDLRKIIQKNQDLQAAALNKGADSLQVYRDHASTDFKEAGDAAKAGTDVVVGALADGGKRMHEIALAQHQSMIDAFTATHKDRANIFRAAAGIAGAFADGIQSQRDAIDQGWADILAGLKHPMTKTKEFALDAGRLVSKELARGLRSGDTVLRHQSEQEVDLIVDRLNHLVTQSGPIGKKGMEELVKAMHSENPRISKAATEVYNLIAGQKAQSAFAAGGQKVGDAWVTNVAKAIDEKAYLVRQSEAKIAKTMIGFSPPKEGPLRNVDVGGFNVGKTWADYLAMGVATASGKVASAMGTIDMGMDFSGPTARSSFRMPGMATIATGPGAAPTLVINVNGVSVLTPGAARALGDQIGPAVAAHFQRNGLAPRFGTGQTG